MSCSRLGLLLLPFLCSPIVAAQGNSATRYTIAFKSFAPYNTDIFIAARNGSNARQLVSNSALDYSATFSRNGEWIIFTSHRARIVNCVPMPHSPGAMRL